MSILVNGIQIDYIMKKNKASLRGLEIVFGGVVVVKIGALFIQVSFLV